MKLLHIRSLGTLLGENIDKVIAYLVTRGNTWMKQVKMGGGWASITGFLVGQRTAPPLLLLLLSFNNCFSMSNFVLATKRSHLIYIYCILLYCS